MNNDLRNLNPLLLESLRKAMQLRIIEISAMLESPVAARTWQKYESGDLAIPEKVAENVFALAKRYKKIKDSGLYVHYAPSHAEFKKLGLSSVPDDYIQFKLEQAVYCSGIIEEYCCTCEESGAKFPTASIKVH